MSNFDINAILRGAQLTLVGAHRALQNPALFTSDHYRQAVLAVVSGLAIRIIISIPVVVVKVLIWMLGLFMNLDAADWDNELIEGLSFIENSVLQVPFFLMSFMRFVSPTLDRMFMESLDWVDRTYIAKHKSDDPTKLRAMYYENLKLYSRHGSGEKKSPMDAALAFLIRYGRRAAISLAVYALSFLPLVGRFVLPAASFYTFNKSVGTPPALVIFGSGLFLPRRYLVVFLQTYFSSRSLMRELLDPYFSRVPYTKAQKKEWFHDRAGVLFGFALAFYAMLKIPLLGVLVYGIAEASTAYLITKITDPPPSPSAARDYAQSQVKWTNKHEFLSLPIHRLDELNAQLKPTAKKFIDEFPGKRFT
ncbi:transmembrane protein UsgS [Eremomyces bilateralis CBS 781.70]|uniref:Transmembrane protein UsgS n=1 Tax=Eremomyces bilateralis CBS 781.70 TaxID=1392243 RepID=A0A6G1GDQ9_9PEZI|nr:transmembrane protein UsgS [Eremomyces bilateralis CBS 781.70]KAF1816154.1 transmembrane protein UsgS [Eremomyces bilateralis CBS 781.70]